MAARKRVLLTVQVEVAVRGPRHCSHDCAYLQTRRTEETAICALFGNEILPWDKRCSEHGYVRASECLLRARLP